MLEIAAGKLIVKKSKFYAHLYKIKSYEEIQEIINQQRNRYSNANHHCYASIINNQKNFQNDGEVGQPGKILLEVLKRNNLYSHVIVVSRVFGGVKLGIGGVSRAFRKAGNGAVNLYKKN